MEQSVTGKRWDVFISHASPDKESIVFPIAEALRRRGASVWLDQWEIGLGDSISASISDGLTQSQFGIVVLSAAFFSRAWPRKELAALFAREADGSNHIIPIWHNVDHSEVLSHAPLLADRMAARSDEGAPAIADRVMRLLHRDKPGASGINREELRMLTKQLFPRMSIDEFWQTQLIADIDLASFRSVADIHRAYRRARRAVEAFAVEQPSLFRSGTDYLTKSLGFVDLCFRRRHNWALVTKEAFDRHSDKIDWDAT